MNIKTIDAYQIFSTKYEVRCGLDTYQGKKRADVRVWVQRKDLLFAPTKSGISLTMQRVRNLHHTLRKLSTHYIGEQCVHIGGGSCVERAAVDRGINLTYWSKR